MIPKTILRNFPFKRLWPLFVLLALAATAYATFGHYLNFESLRENRETLLGFAENNYLLASGCFLAVYILIVAFSLPGAAVASLAGGFLFGLPAGTFLNVVAATCGAGIIFIAARYGLGAQLAKKMDASTGAVRTIKQGLHDNELSYLFLMRLVPAVPFFAANLIPAFVGVSLRRFLFTTFFGIIPGALVFTWIGVGLGDIFALGETPDFRLIFKPQILGPILALSALAALPILVNRGKKRKSPEHE